MTSITLSDLVGKPIKKIQSGSELLYIYELSRYVKELLNSNLTIGDAVVQKSVRDGEHFAYVYSKGLELNYSPTADELADISDATRRYTVGDIRGVSFEKQTKSEWVYNYNTNRTANMVLNGYNRSAGYVSLFAFMVVSAYKDKREVPKLVLKNSAHRQEELEYVDILILKNFGNRMLAGKVDIEFSSEVVVQPEWEAYIMYHRQNGLMNRDSRPTEKYRWTLQHLIVGDVVLYYKTERKIESKAIRKLTSCLPAVVREITKDYVKIEYYPTITTKLTHFRQLKQAELECDSEYTYSSEDYKRFDSCIVTLEYISTGIDVLTYKEDSFILRAQNGTDTFEQFLKNKKGVESAYQLDTLNTIYAVFEDRGVNYDKDRFLSLHFSKEQPVYDKVTGLESEKTKIKKEG